MSYPFDPHVWARLMMFSRDGISKEATTVRALTASKAKVPRPEIMVTTEIGRERAGSWPVYKERLLVWEEIDVTTLKAHNERTIHCFSFLR